MATATSPSRTSASGITVRAWTEIAAWRRRRALYSRTLSELEHLTDRDLADLGIARTDVRRIARDAVYGA